MLTLEKLTAAARELPAEFSLGQLVDSLLRLEQPDSPAAAASGEANRYTSPEALALYAQLPVPPQLQALRGIAAGLPPDDLRKSAKEWEAERIWEKYGV